MGAAYAALGAKLRWEGLGRLKSASIGDGNGGSHGLMRSDRAEMFECDILVDGWRLATRMSGALSGEQRGLRSEACKRRESWESLHGG